MDLGKDKLIGKKIFLLGADGKTKFQYVVTVKLDTKEKIAALNEGMAHYFYEHPQLNEFVLRASSADPQKPLYYCEPGPDPTGYRGKQPRVCLLYAEEIMAATV
jgi:hypothetical protein